MPCGPCGGGGAWLCGASGKSVKCSTPLRHSQGHGYQGVYSADEDYLRRTQPFIMSKLLTVGRTVKKILAPSFSSFITVITWVSQKSS